MANSPRQLVIRTYAPARRWLLLGGATTLVLLASYVCYEYGRYRAGYDRLAAARDQSALQEQIRALQVTSREQRVQLAALDASRIGQARERTEVSRTIGELQAQVARQAQDLAFYRGIVGKSAQAPAVKIQQFTLLALGVPHHYTLRIVLGRPVRPEDLISGTIAVTIEGSEGDKVAAYELARITKERKRDLRFNFRYLQTLEQELSLPEQFRPLRTTVEIRANRGLTPVRETFLWTAETT